MNKMRSRGVEDILMAVVDGHEGFPDAISARVSGRHGADLHCAMVQTCIVHLLRNSLDFVT
jgi:putative transposase